jgi:O-antigen/teichoic acid export membrane protein
MIFIARSLGATEYGRYVYLITASSILPLFAGLGAEHVFIMEASKKQRLIPFLFGNAFFIRVVITIAALIVVAIGLILFRIPDFKVVLLLTAGSLIAVFSNPLFLSLYRVKGCHVRPWLICFITPLSYILFLFFVGKENMNIYLVSLGFFLSNLFSIIIFLIDTRKMIKMKISFKLIIFHFKSGLFFSVSQIFDLAFARLDIFLLQFLVGSYAVGIYTAGQRVVSVFQLIPSSFHVVELPEFHRISLDADKLLAKFRSLRSLLLELSLLVFVLLIINASIIIKILFGTAYSEAASVVVLLSFAGILLFVNYPYYMLAEAINKIKQRLYIRIAAFLLTLILVTLLIKTIGIIGAAFGLLVGQLLFMVLLHWLTQKANGGMKIFLKDSKMIFLAIFAGFLAFYLGNFLNHVWLKFLTCSGVFLLLFVAIGHFLGYLQSTKLVISLAKAVILRKRG